MVRILSLCYQRTQFQNIKWYWVSKIPTPIDFIQSPDSIKDTRWLCTKRYQTKPVSKILLTDGSYTKPCSIKDTRWLCTNGYQTISVSKILTSDDSYTRPYGIKDTKWLSTKECQSIPKIPRSNDSYTRPYRIKDTKWQSTKRYQTIPVSKILMSDDSYTKSYGIKDTKWRSTKRYQTIPVSKILIPDDSYTKSYGIKDTKWRSTSRSPKVNSEWTPCKAGSKKGSGHKVTRKGFWKVKVWRQNWSEKISENFARVLDWTPNWAHRPVYMRHRLAILYTVTSAFSPSKLPAVLVFARQLKHARRQIEPPALPPISPSLTRPRQHTIARLSRTRTQERCTAVFPQAMSWSRI